VTEPAAAIRVIRNPERHRYEIWSGDRMAGFSAYREGDRATVFTHTEIDDTFGGQGLGTILVREALDDTVRRERTIVPLCPFVTRVLQQTSDYDDHVRWPQASSTGRDE
jgi:predicted GNAT family acetyltransferase